MSCNHKKQTCNRLLFGVSLLGLLASASPVYAKDFVDTWGMRRHARGGP